jgi:hypothetical protein
LGPAALLLASPFVPAPKLCGSLNFTPVLLHSPPCAGDSELHGAIASDDNPFIFAGFGQILKNFAKIFIFTAQTSIFALPKNYV